MCYKIRNNAKRLYLLVTHDVCANFLVIIKLVSIFKFGGIVKSCIISLELDLF